MSKRPRKEQDPKEARLNQLMDELLEGYDGTNPEFITAKDGLMNRKGVEK